MTLTEDLLAEGLSQRIQNVKEQYTFPSFELVVDRFERMGDGPLLPVYDLYLYTGTVTQPTNQEEMLTFVTTKLADILDRNGLISEIEWSEYSEIEQADNTPTLMGFTATFTLKGT